jgi:Protein of unknown function (DUF3099)
MVENMRQHRDQVQVVTEARRSKSDDISYRERRYLIMMAIRVVCFIVAFLLFINHFGWLTAIPAVGAIIIPYFAVVLANGGREPSGGPGFREYQANLPARFDPPGWQAGTGPAEPGRAGNAGAPTSNNSSPDETRRESR